MISLAPPAPAQMAPIPELMEIATFAALFVRDEQYTSFVGDANMLMHATMRGVKTQWKPRLPQLCNALITLAAMGVSLNPARQEACLLSFWKDGGHDVVPNVMKHGLIRIAAEMYPIVNTTEQIVMKGDLWEYEETETGPRMRWRPGDGRAVLANMGDLSPIEGAWSRIDFFDERTGRAWHITGALVGEDFREKLKANKNAKSPKDGSAWSQHRIAMMEKTILRYVLSHKLPLRGDPAFAMRLTSESESNSRALLTEYAAQRGLALPEGVDAAPASSTQKLIEEAPVIPDINLRPGRTIRDEILACTNSQRLDEIEEEIAGRDSADRNYLDNVLADRRAHLEEK